MDTVTLPRPDDWHLHLRDDAALASVLPWTARQFGRALVMPNLRPPVRTVADAAAYRERILAALPPGADFTPLLTLYLTDDTDPDEIRRARDSGFVHAVKLYPAGATTHSDAGVTDLRRVDRVLAVMAEVGLPLCVHGEVTDPRVDVFDREAVFLERALEPLHARFPELPLVLEHVTTAEGVAWVREARGRVGATLTAHHLLLDRNALFDGGLRPHHYCLPVLKRARHREALLEAATSGDPRFFLGTDSAPHAVAAKESDCGCAGMFTAAHALELYAEAFDAAGALDRLAAFASRNGAAFYGLPVNPGVVRLVRAPQTIPDALPFGEDRLIPFRASGQTRWTFQEGADS